MKIKNSEIFTVAFLTAITFASIALVQLSFSDDVYLRDCSVKGLKKIWCTVRYFMLWVLPYWWLLIFVFGTLVGLISVGLSTLISKLK